MSDRIIKPQDGPQMMAAKSKARIVIYGGAAGGGKSWLQAFMAARHVDVPGYNAILFRRTFPMLQGGGSLLEETQSFYPELGGVFNLNRFEWRFPSRALVELKHLQHEKDAKAHKSKQYTRVGMDEASDFEGSQIFFLNSRLRTTTGLRKQLLLTTNPDPDCALRTLIDWWIGEDGYPIPERAGIVRFWVRIKDEIVWADDPDSLLRYVDNDPHSINSLTFIPSKVTDNRILMEKDPGYMANLKSLIAVERDRYLGGNWNVKESAGDYFQKACFKPWGATDLERALRSQDGRPGEIVQSVRCWDLASTPVTGDLVPGLQRPLDFKARDKSMEDPDWTCSVRLDRVRNGRVIISDVTFHRDTPGAVQALQERTAIQDGPKVNVVIFADPGQAGEDQAARVAATLRRHAPVHVMDTLKKEWHARESARAAWRGELYYMEAGWNTRFFNQLETFPTPKAKDDAVIALSGAYRYLTEHPCAFPKIESVDIRHPDIVLADPRLAQQMYSKKERIKRGVMRVEMPGRRWGMRNY